MHVRLSRGFLNAQSLILHAGCSGFKFSQLEMSKSENTVLHLCGMLMRTYAEIVIAALLPSFSFELTDSPILWNTAAVTYPSMDKQGGKPEMRLKVTALKD